MTWRTDLIQLLQTPKGSSEAEAFRGRLAASDESDLFAEVVRLACDPASAERTAWEAGGLVGRILWRQGKANGEEVPLHDFSGPAYLGFDKAISDAEQGGRGRDRSHRLAAQRSEVTKGAKRPYSA